MWLCSKFKWDSLVCEEWFVPFIFIETALANDGELMINSREIAPFQKGERN